MLQIALYLDQIIILFQTDRNLFEVELKIGYMLYDIQARLVLQVSILWQIWGIYTARKKTVLT